MVHFVLISVIILSISKYKNTRLTGLAFFVLTLFATLRYRFGNDYNSYMRAHEDILQGEVVFEEEWSYVFLNRIIPNHYILIAVTSLFFIYVIYKLITKHLDEGVQGLALLIFIINPYLFLMNLSAIRQCIAMCIFILATKLLQNKKSMTYIVYIALILLASTFHISALCLLPICFFIDDKDMNKVQVFLIASAMILLLLEGGVVTHLVNTGISFLDNSEYMYYYSQGLQNSLRATLLMGVYFIYVAMNLAYLKGYKLVCGKLYLIGLFVSMLAYYFSMITRIQMYFEIFSIVTIPAIIEYHLNAVEGKWKKIVNLYLFPAVLLIIYVARYYSFFANPMWERFGTYHTIFEVLF